MAPDVSAGRDPTAETIDSTRWSIVLAAAERGSPVADRALGELCEMYWRPLYAYIRRRGASHDDAQDLTQAFFARLIEREDLARANPERGRFRAFIFTALKNFLVNEREREQAQKRGGGRVKLSLDFDSNAPGYRIEAVDDVTPERLFDREWALALLATVLERLRTEYERAGNAALFDRLRCFLVAGAEIPASGELARELGLSEGAVRVAVHRLRRSYGARLREQVAETVSDRADIEDEMRSLMTAFDF